MATKNAIRDFLNKYAGKETEIDIEKLSGKIMEAYKNAYSRIYEYYQKTLYKIDYPTHAKQTEILKHIGKILDDYQETYTNHLMDAIEATAKAVAHGAIMDIGLYAKPIKSMEWHYKFAEDYARTVLQDNFDHIAAQTQNMKNTVKKKLREIAKNVFDRASIEGLSPAQVYDEIKKDIFDKMPTFEFIDKAGRRWDTSNYFDMLTRTVLLNTTRESYINTMINEKQDLAMVNVVGSTDACREFEGKIISLTGATKGYPTFEELKASKKIFHPRCRHRVVAYHPDIAELIDKKEIAKNED